jgi:hypothetical protein
MNIPTPFHIFAAPQAGSVCSLGKPDFLNFPRWYDYLPGTYVPASTNPNGTVINAYCQPQLTAINDIWLVAAAVVEILLRVSALVAVGFVVYGGIQFITAQGEPDKANKARQTIISALIGLVISIAAATVVTFIAGSFTS